MSKDKEFYEELDYEIDEDALLESENEEELNLVKQMSSASFTSDPELKHLEGTSNAVHLPDFNWSDDFWLKSISTLSTVTNFRPNTPANESEETKEMRECLNGNNLVPKYGAEPEQIEKEVVQPVIQVEREVLDRKGVEVVDQKGVEVMDVDLDTRQINSLPLNDNVEAMDKINGLVDSKEVRETNGRSIDISSQSSSSSSKITRPKIRRSKKKYYNNGNYGRYTRAFQHTTVSVNHKKHQLPSLMSLTPMVNGYPNGVKGQPLVCINVSPAIKTYVALSTPLPNAPKKNPFIIHTESNGTAVSRRVEINPKFDGFTKRQSSNGNNISIVIKRGRSQDNIGSDTTDLRNVVVHKRLPRSVIEPCAAKTADGVACSMKTDNKELSQEIDCETDELKNYLNEIEKQKLKREEVLRQKELRREQQGWHFTE